MIHHCERSLPYGIPGRKRDAALPTGNTFGGDKNRFEDDGPAATDIQT